MIFVGVSGRGERREERREERGERGEERGERGERGGRREKRDRRGERDDTREEISAHRRRKRMGVEEMGLSASLITIIWSKSQTNRR